MCFAEISSRQSLRTKFNSDSRIMCSSSSSTMKKSAQFKVPSYVHTNFIRTARCSKHVNVIG